tara:strand:- start:753 stop:887 length:135 start_codon:yes stop_codon:yes gene_type:complete
MQMKTHLYAILLCLLGTWFLFAARDTLSQEFFRIDIQDTREEAQ